MDCSSPGSSVCGILQARILEWFAISSSRGSFPPRNRTYISCISHIADGFFTAKPSGKIYTFSNYLSSACHMSDTILGILCIIMNKTTQDTCPLEALWLEVLLLHGEINTKHRVQKITDNLYNNLGCLPQRLISLSSGVMCISFSMNYIAFISKFLLH